GQKSEQTEKPGTHPSMYREYPPFPQRNTAVPGATDRPLPNKYICHKARSSHDPLPLSEAVCPQKAGHLFLHKEKDRRLCFCPPCRSSRTHRPAGNPSYLRYLCRFLSKAAEAPCRFLSFLHIHQLRPGDYPERCFPFSSGTAI